MNNLLSSQHTTNTLLIILVATILISIFVSGAQINKLQKTLNYISSNVDDMSSSLKQVREDTKYIQISTEQTANILER